MKVNIYSDKFSGTLTASEVLAEIKTIFRNASIQASYFPVTDGGEDSTEILKHVEGEKYFLGGQYDYIDDNDFNGIFECGPKGLANPKVELRNSARKLVKQISI